MSFGNGSHPLRRHSKSERQVRAALRCCFNELRGDVPETAVLWRRGLYGGDEDVLLRTLALWSRSLRGVERHLVEDDLEVSSARTTLCALQGQVASELGGLTSDSFTARATLLSLAGHLNRAESRLARLVEIERPRQRKVVVSSELLFELQLSLFPAERMYVVAGRRRGATATLTAAFDVTGEFSGASVRAEPNLLGRALVAMELSGSYLAAWIHSHPGRGALATAPSSIDLRQQADWLRHYTPDLVSAIFVEDGWIRFWGPAVEAKRVELAVIGDGVLEEARDQHLWRLSS
jgi:hypothetical protein